MEVWGLFAFAVVFVLWDRIRRLERILRGNDIEGGDAHEAVHSVLTFEVAVGVLALYEDGGGTTTICRILDVDEEWARILRNEGKKNQREMLIRLSDVKQIKG